MTKRIHKCSSEIKFLQEKKKLYRIKERIEVLTEARSLIAKKAQVNVELTMVNHLLSRSEKTKKDLIFCSLESLAVL